MREHATFLHGLRRHSIVKLMASTSFRIRKKVSPPYFARIDAGRDSRHKISADCLNIVTIKIIKRQMMKLRGL